MRARGFPFTQPIKSYMFYDAGAESLPLLQHRVVRSIPAYLQEIIQQIPVNEKFITEH